MLHCLCGFWKCLSLIFWSLDRIYFGVSCLFLFLHLLFLVFAGLPRFLVGYPALTGGNPQALLVQIFLLFPFFLWYSHYVYIIPFVLASGFLHILWEVCGFFSFFPLLFSFERLDWEVLKFGDCFLSCIILFQCYWWLIFLFRFILRISISLHKVHLFLHSLYFIHKGP